MNRIGVIVVSMILMIGISEVKALEAWKAVVPKSSGVTQGHLRFPSPFISGHTHFGADIDANCGDEIFPLYAGEIVALGGLDTIEM